MPEQVEIPHPITSLGPAAGYLADARRRLGPLFLHTGCGTHLVPGWVNTDVVTLVDPGGSATQEGEAYSVGGRAVYLKHDASRPYPLADGSIRWVYNEHFIEHLGLEDALRWLREMHRLLDARGRIRVSTPDLEQFVRGYLDERQELFDAWRAEIKPHLVGVEDLPARRAVVLNLLFEHWGHRWIYDLEELACILSLAGFHGVERRDFRQGGEPRLAELDQDWRRVGTLYVEALRSAPARS
jgi:predicted SAM-dependent methyltransferase